MISAPPVTNRLLPSAGICKEPRYGLVVPSRKTAPLGISCAGRKLTKAAICTASLNATCAAGQTQTVTRKSSSITIAPPKGKEKSPKLDDGGTNGPPFFGGGGWGGGGGGWGKSSGFRCIRPDSSTIIHREHS